MNSYNKDNLRDKYNLWSAKINIINKYKILKKNIKKIKNKKKIY